MLLFKKQKEPIQEKMSENADVISWIGRVFQREDADYTWLGLFIKIICKKYYYILLFNIF